MPSADLSMSFASTSGSTFAFYLFLALSLFIGIAVYQVLTRLLPQKLKQATAVSRLPALFVSGMLALLVFTSVYFSMIYGFYEMRIRGDEIHLTYILPRHTVVLRRAEVSEGIRNASYRGQWYLTIYTQSGRPYHSASSSYRSVLDGWQKVQDFLGK
jgi:hypothetical protein